MSATPDLDALTARAQQLAGTCTCDTHTLIRDLLTYSTSVRHERDEWEAAARVAGGLKNYAHAMWQAAEQQVASLTAQLAEARKWQPIEAAPKDQQALFWVVAKNIEDTAYCDTAGNRIFVQSPPRIEMTKRGCWSSLHKATHWMPLPEPPK